MTQNSGDEAVEELFLHSHMSLWYAIEPRVNFTCYLSHVCSEMLVTLLVNYLLYDCGY